MAEIKGGQKAAAYLARLAQRLATPRTLRVGFLENARYPDGKPVAMIAAIQNFGAPRANIPARPFFSNMIAAKQKEWPAAIAGLMKANQYNVDKVLDIAGHAIAGQLRQSIRDTNAPPLSPYTVAKKGHSKPLVDTGHMLNSVDHEVQR